MFDRKRKRKIWTKYIKEKEWGQRRGEELFGE